MSNDPELGRRINEVLLAAGIETPMSTALPIGSRHDVIGENFASILDALGMDLQDDSLNDTPRRMAKMYQNEIFTGLDYDNFPACTTIANKMSYNEMIVVKGCDVLSVCEHHLVPFVGLAHVAYIPNHKVLGLSKFNRVVDFFSRRPQVQERLTEQVSAALQYILDTPDVAVVIKAQHMCVKLRGVKQSNSETVTSKVTGKFMEKQSVRDEFFSLVNGK
jgi:GTP cyclohydrolase I